MVLVLLRLEGLFLFLAALFIYTDISGDWVMFFLLLFLPDISMIGYVKNNTIGAIVYNLIHNYVMALMLFFIGYFIHFDFLQFVGIVLAAHIGMDRTLGFGLKQQSGFKDTHLGRIRKIKI